MQADPGPAKAPADEKTPLAGPSSSITDPKDHDLPSWAQALGPATLIGVSVALQMFFGVGMSITNKELTNLIPLPVLDTAMQMVFTVLSLTTIFCSKQHIGSWKVALRWLCGPPVLFGLQLTSSMIGTAKLSLAAQISVRNLSPLVTMPIERCCTEAASVTIAMLLSMLLSLAGALLFFATSSVMPDAEGVGWIVFNMAVAISGRLLERRFLAVDKLDISVSSGLLLNNVVGLLPVGAFFFVRQEHRRLGELSAVAPVGWVALGLSCVLGLGIGWSGLFLQKQITATAMLVVISMNKFIVVAFGILALQEDHSPLVVAGCVLGLLGGLAFGYSGLRLKQRNERAKKAESEPAADEQQPDETAASADAGCARGCSELVDRDVWDVLKDSAKGTQQQQTAGAGGGGDTIQHASDDKAAQLMAGKDAKPKVAAETRSAWQQFFSDSDKEHEVTTHGVSEAKVPV